MGKEIENENRWEEKVRTEILRKIERLEDRECDIQVSRERERMGRERER